ncbi:hypothetical protein [Pseudalkalibacillus caeni]|uniref:Uncharacterized protein n=1 Tax=Exobacillus caeni TaxID=2574798 RepID=A0A5R9F1W4_9BACL|nr:hypothetical protein [Pseudalkalibacillus caeni]TLS35448.1 hypothetical protein FCL54_20340 [Pseudalkalibacillus caeni]
MSIYQQCCQYQGQVVRIWCHDGVEHIGEITRVDREFVWVRPVGDGPGGPGYGFYGWGWGFPLALAAIAGLAILPFFFW